MNRGFHESTPRLSSGPARWKEAVIGMGHRWRPVASLEVGDVEQSSLRMHGARPLSVSPMQIAFGGGN